MRNTTQIKVRLPKQLHLDMQVIAAARGVTITTLVRTAIIEELAGPGQTPRSVGTGATKTEQGKGS